jgi:hypothetical protein
MYHSLRSRFIDILRDLGDLSGDSIPTDREQKARIAYWHHAYDEWRLSRLAPKPFGNLWSEQFRNATIAGYAHPALRDTFDELRSDTTVGFGSYAQDFVKGSLEGLPGSPAEMTVRQGDSDGPPVVP